MDTPEEKTSITGNKRPSQRRADIAATLSRISEAESSLGASGNVYYNGSEIEALKEAHNQQKVLETSMSGETGENSFLAANSQKKGTENSQGLIPAMTPEQEAAQHIELENSTEEVTDNPLGVLDGLISGSGLPVEDEQEIVLRSERTEEFPASVEVQNTETEEEHSENSVQEVQQVTQPNSAVEAAVMDEMRLESQKNPVAISSVKPEEEVTLTKSAPAVKPIAAQEEADDDSGSKKADEEEKEEFIEVQELLPDVQLNSSRELRKNVFENSELDDIFKNVDSNDLKVTGNTNVVDISTYINEVLTPKSSTQVVAMQSSYAAHMTELNFSDRDVLMNSTADGVNSSRKRFKIIYSKIIDSSIGRMTFDEWLKVTAYADLDVLMYGIYAQTFPDSNEFDIRCAYCGSTTKVSVLPSQLVSMVNKEANFAMIQNILKSQVSSALDILNNSMVNKRQKHIMPDSRAVIETLSPSCLDYLDHISRYDPNRMDDDQETFGTMLYVGRIYTPNLSASKKYGKPIFDEIASKDFERKFNIIKKLSNRDGSALTKLINTRESVYQVQHRLKGVQCQTCRRDLGNIPIDMSNLLFFLLRRQTQLVSDK